MKKFSKNQKYAFVAAVLVLAIGTGLLSKSDSLQGFLNFGRFRGAAVNCNSPIFKYGIRYVTPVVSPVTSVVVSPVTSLVASLVTSTVVSAAGPSLVASVVTSAVTSNVASAVTSAVASAVSVPGPCVNMIKMRSLPMLTANVLHTNAKIDFLNNRAKYRLSNSEKQKLVSMYKQRHPRQQR